MATWGPSKKRETKALPAGRSSSPSRTTKGGTRTNGSSSRTVNKARYTADEEARRHATRREQATGELRRAIAGREHEFIGLTLLVAAIILAAGIYFDFTGILGDGTEWLGGALAGLGRFVLPLLLLAVGVSFVRSGRSSSPYRLVIGWALVALAALGILHIARGPEGFSVKGVTDAGGVLGWAVGEPLRTVMAEFGADRGARRRRHRGAAADHPGVDTVDRGPDRAAAQQRSPAPSDGRRAMPSGTSRR